MPTRETRTHASMTMPLSSTRSSTSMRLVPPAARSTVILTAPSFSTRTEAGSSRARPALPSGRRRQRQHPLLQLAQLLAQRQVLLYHLLAAGREVPVVLPPVEPDFLRLVDGTDHQADADGQQFHFGQRNLDVAGDDKALVEHPIED